MLLLRSTYHTGVDGSREEPVADSFTSNEIIVYQEFSRTVDIIYYGITIHYIQNRVRGDPLPFTKSHTIPPLVPVLLIQYNYVYTLQWCRQEKTKPKIHRYMYMFVTAPPPPLKTILPVLYRNIENMDFINDFILLHYVQYIYM